MINGDGTVVVDSADDMTKRSAVANRINRTKRGIVLFISSPWFVGLFFV